MQPATNHFDIAIIGGSLAGSTTAVIAGRAGLRTLLVDKSHFPRRKPCGEGLSMAGLRVAMRHGLWDVDSPPLASLPFRGFRLHAGQKWHELPLAQFGGIAVERSELDVHWLTTASSIPAVTVLTGAAALPFADQRGHGLTVGEASYTARYLVLADGGNSPAARLLGLPCIHTGASRMGASVHFQGEYAVRPSQVCISITPSYELYATPLPNGRLNLAVLASTRTDVNLRKVLLNPSLTRDLFRAMTFKGVPIEAPLGRAPMGRVIRRSHTPRLLLVGDAAEAFDPIGGMGMTHALISAELAANRIIQAEQGLLTVDSIHKRYEISRYKLATPFRRFTKLSYVILRTSQRCPMLLRAVTSSMGRAVAERMAV